MSEAIQSFRGEYGFLSNMYQAFFEWDGRTYQCSEAAFQSAKTMDPQERDAFGAMNGVTAKRSGRRVKLRPDWERVKLAVMEEVVRAKFSQNPELLKKLIATGDRELVEGNRWHDAYWGVDLASGEGENHLGRILMKLRSELGGARYVEAAERMKAEREAVAQKREEELKGRREALERQLAALPQVDLTGMTVGTKAFGQVTVQRQEGGYLFFEARGAVRKFALPGCVLQGFVIPNDPAVAEALRRREALEQELAQLNSGG